LAALGVVLETLAAHGSSVLVLTGRRMPRGHPEPREITATS
jgi:hypothetical protein